MGVYRGGIIGVLRRILAGLDYSTLQFCMRQPPFGKRLITSARQRQGHKSTDHPEGQGFRDSRVQHD